MDNSNSSGSSKHVIPKKGKLKHGGSRGVRVAKQRRSFFCKGDGSGEIDRWCVLEKELLSWKISFFKPSNGFLPLFSKEQMSVTPSNRHGMNGLQEKELRSATVEAMFIIGDKCKLPYTTIGTACVYFHRFFMQESMRVHTPYEVGVSMLFLASKSESSRIKLYDLARIYFDTKLMDKKKYLLKTTLEECLACYRLQDKELLGAQVNKFDFQVDLPHDWILPITTFFIKYYIKNSHNSNSNSNNNNNEKRNVITSDWKEYSRIGWKFVNVSLRSVMIIAFPPQWIAISCMELSMRYFDNLSIKYQIPSNWFKIFDSTLTESTLNAIIIEILSVCDSKQFQSSKKEIANHEKKRLILSSIRSHACQMSQNMSKYLPQARTAAHFQHTKDYDPNAIDWTLYPLPKHLNNATNINLIKQLLNNKQAISPMTLAPHKYLLKFELNPECYIAVEPVSLGANASNTSNAAVCTTGHHRSSHNVITNVRNNTSINTNDNHVNNNTNDNQIMDDDIGMPPAKKRKRQSRWDQEPPLFN